jgi:competence protein ComEC
MRFADFPFLRYLPFLIFGILVSRNGIPFPSLLILCMTLGMWLLYFLSLPNKGVSKTFLPSVLAYLSLFLAGLTLNELEQLKSEKRVDPELINSKSYFAEVTRYDLEKPNSKENLVEVLAWKDSLGWRPSKGKVLIYHQSQTPLRPGDKILVQNSPEPIPPPMYPNEFDYRGFLARKEIHFRQFVGTKFVLAERVENSFWTYPMENLREKLSLLLKEKIPHTNSQSIAGALLLGQKQSLDPELRNAYAQAGVMHILAVSGLHVGILYAVFLFPLKGLQLGKKARKRYLLMIVGIIWMYAVLTGLAPSVVRASTMFSLITLGQMRDRKPSTFNVLAFSAILMIAFDPEVIFEVGFQLSYLAVAGIVLIQPLIVNLWLPSNRFLEYFWQLTAVSLAAQLATFPLSVYYFHIFPVYFLLANLLVIPLAFLIMQVGIPFLFLGWMPWIGESLGWVLSWMIEFQNQIALSIRDLPFGRLDRLTINLFGMILVWGILLIWADWEFGNRKKLLFLTVSLVFIWSGERLIKEWNKPLKELIIFNSDQGVLFDLRYGRQYWSWNQGFAPDQISFSIEPDRIAGNRPQFPHSLNAIRDGSGNIFIPGLDMVMDLEKQRFLWQRLKPSEVHYWQDNDWQTGLVSDTLYLNKPVYRIVF